MLLSFVDGKNLTLSLISDFTEFIYIRAITILLHSNL